MLGGQGGVLPNKVLRGKGVAFWGTPAQPVREYLKQLAALARLAEKRRMKSACSFRRSAMALPPKPEPGAAFMAIVVIGGHSRSVGKTSVVAGLIAALPEYDWTAVKITQYGHGVCSANGEPCHCATGDHSLGDFGREGSHRRVGHFSLSGWRARRGRGGCAPSRDGWRRPCRPLRQQARGVARNVILESNSMLKFLRPDLVFDGARSGDGGFQEFGAGVSGSRGRGDPARAFE